MVSYGLLRRVALVRTDVSEEPGASFIRVTKIGELETTQAATNNRRTLRRNTTWKPQILHRKIPVIMFALSYRINGLVCDTDAVTSQLCGVTPSHSSNITSLTPFCTSLIQWPVSKPIPRLTCSDRHGAAYCPLIDWMLDWCPLFRRGIGCKWPSHELDDES
jgi:hypothetical protein